MATATVVITKEVIERVVKEEKEIRSYQLSLNQEEAQLVANWAAHTPIGPDNVPGKILNALSAAGISYKAGTFKIISNK